jgi:hypothetical protein
MSTADLQIGIKKSIGDFISGFNAPLAVENGITLSLTTGKMLIFLKWLKMGGEYLWNTNRKHDRSLKW